MNNVQKHNNWIRKHVEMRKYNSGYRKSGPNYFRRKVKVENFNTRDEMPVEISKQIFSQYCFPYHFRCNCAVEDKQMMNL
jgi:hypothetical protein